MSMEGEGKRDETRLARKYIDVLTQHLSRRTTEILVETSLTSLHFMLFLCECRISQGTRLRLSRPMLVYTVARQSHQIWPQSRIIPLQISAQSSRIRDREQQINFRKTHLFQHCRCMIFSKYTRSQAILSASLFPPAHHFGTHVNQTNFGLAFRKARNSSRSFIDVVLCEGTRLLNAVA